MKTLVSSLTVVCALAFTARVHAAGPMAVASEGQPVTPCLGTAGCAIVGIGDFNGDGADDLLTHAPGSNSTTAYQELGIHFGQKDGARRATSRIEMVAHSGTRVSVQDINDDGMDDVVMSAARVNSQLETLRVSVVLGRREFPQKTLVGELHRGDLVVHRSENRMSGRNSLAANVTAVFGDFNGDGKSDLVLGRDPAQMVPQATDRSAALPLPRDGKSEVLVMFGDGEWSGRLTFRTDATVTGLGRCTATLAAFGDVTGDGVDDIVVRRCAARGMPDLAGVVPGRPSPDTFIEVAGALPIPDPEEPAPRNPGRGRIPGGYIPEGSANSRLVAFGSLVASPVASLADTNSDGTADVIMDLAGRLHVWHGGPDIAQRMAASESSGILVNASFSSVQLSRAWQLADLDSDGSPEFVVVRTSDQAHDIGVPVAPSPVALVALDAGKMGPLVDLNRAAPKLTWQDGPALWGLGDFNGDGFADVLSSRNQTSDLEFAMNMGPFTAAP